MRDLFIIIMFLAHNGDNLKAIIFDGFFFVDVNDFRKFRLLMTNRADISMNI